MNTYSTALFLHIVGALVLFATLALEWVSLQQIRNARSSEQVRTWMGILNGASKAGFPSMLMTVITGVYMMMVWGRTPWLADRQNRGRKHPDSIRPALPRSPQTGARSRD